MTNRILVWDAPTRIFHWLFAACFAGAFLTADTERYRDVHVMLGCTMLGLIAFRLVWGVAGARYARFSSFAFGPASVWAYLKSLPTRAPMHFTGHNPAGAWAIYALLALGVLTSMSGYAAYNEIGGDALKELHEVFANAMLALVLIHIAAVLLSSFIHRENLVRAMLDGYKSGHAEQAAPRAPRVIGVMLLAGVISLWTMGPALLGQNRALPPEVAATHEAEDD